MRNGTNYSFFEKLFREITSPKAIINPVIHTNNLENLILHTNPSNADEIIVISGYVTTPPVIHIAAQKKQKIFIINGMVPIDGITQAQHQSFIKTANLNPHLNIRYSKTKGIHAKVYCWRKNGHILHSYLGSANFTNSGLNTPNKELLIDVPSLDYIWLNNYINLIISDTEDCRATKLRANLKKPKLITAPSTPTPASFNTTIRFSLLTAEGNIPPGSGINWGQTGKSHTKKQDAYIRIPKNIIRFYPGFFNPKPPKENLPLDLLWDDGTAMRGLAEGDQRENGIKFPKQIASTPKKSILGIYLRKRLGIDTNAFVTLKNLNDYGRTHVDITLMAPGSYYLDFSTPPKQPLRISP